MTSVYTTQLTSKNLICYVKPILAAATLPAFIKPKIAVDENHVNFCIFLYYVVVCQSVCLSHNVL